MGSGLKLIKVACFFKLTADRELVFVGIAGSCQVNLLKERMIFRTPVKANQGLKVNQIINLCPIQMFFAALFCVDGDHSNSKEEAKQYIENLTTKLQNSNQNSTFPGLA